VTLNQNLFFQPESHPTENKKQKTLQDKIQITKNIQKQKAG
jgi:hypothetical protein